MAQVLGGVWGQLKPSLWWNELVSVSFVVWCYCGVGGSRANNRAVVDLEMGVGAVEEERHVGACVVVEGAEHKQTWGVEGVEGVEGGVGEVCLGGEGGTHMEMGDEVVSETAEGGVGAVLVVGELVEAQVSEGEACAVWEAPEHKEMGDLGEKVDVDSDEAFWALSSSDSNSFSWDSASETSTIVHNDVDQHEFTSLDDWTAHIDAFLESSSTRPASPLEKDFDFEVPTPRLLSRCSAPADKMFDSAAPITRASSALSRASSVLSLDSRPSAPADKMFATANYLGVEGAEGEDMEISLGGEIGTHKEMEIEDGWDSEDSGVCSGFKVKRTRHVKVVEGQACAEWAKWEHKEIGALGEEVGQDFDLDFSTSRDWDTLSETETVVHHDIDEYEHTSLADVIEQINMPTLSSQSRPSAPAGKMFSSAAPTGRLQSRPSGPADKMFSSAAPTVRASKAPRLAATSINSPLAKMSGRGAMLPSLVNSESPAPAIKKRTMNRAAPRKPLASKIPALSLVSPSRLPIPEVFDTVVVAPLETKPKISTAEKPSKHGPLIRPSVLAPPAIKKSVSEVQGPNSNFSRTMANLARQRQNDLACEEASRVRAVAEKKKRVEEVKARKLREAARSEKMKRERGL